MYLHKTSKWGLAVKCTLKDLSHCASSVKAASFSPLWKKCIKFFYVSQKKYMANYFDIIISKGSWRVVESGSAVGKNVRNTALSNITSFHNFSFITKLLYQSTTIDLIISNLSSVYRQGSRIRPIEMFSLYIALWPLIIRVTCLAFRPCLHETPLFSLTPCCGKKNGKQC